MPPGWITVSAPSTAQINCVDEGLPTDWRVALDGDRLQVAKLKEIDSDPLPFKLPVPADEVTEAGHWPVRHVLRVDDGWLVGFDAGEWDGSLWWFNADGTQSRELEGYVKGAFAKALTKAEQNRTPFVWHFGNVLALFKLGSAILAFTGTGHLTLDEGLVYSVERGPGAWTAKQLADLGAMPEVATPISNDSALVVTDKGLLSVSASGQVRPLKDVYSRALYVNSIASVDGNVIYVGMRDFVIALVKSGSTYDVQWYAQASNTCASATTASPTP